MNRIEDWALAIKKHEGWITPKDNNSKYPKGTPSYRNNNPGNMRCTNLTKELGATGCTNNLSVFPTYEVGFNALKQFLIYACTNKLRSYKSTMNLLEFYQKYAPSNDGNNPVNYSSDVAKQLGVSTYTKISDLYEGSVPENMNIKIENQRDIKWKKWYLGKVKTSGFNLYGCLLFCFSYIYSVKMQKQISPSVIDKMFVDEGVYNGDLIDSVKACEVLGLTYLGKEKNINKAPDWFPTIKEVRFDNNWSQHFVVRENINGKNVILDPWDGVQRVINYYELKVDTPNWERGGFSYRKVKINR